jgi:hypothetical protein
MADVRAVTPVRPAHRFGLVHGLALAGIVAANELDFNMITRLELVERNLALVRVTLTLSFGRLLRLSAQLADLRLRRQPDDVDVVARPAR